MGAFILLSILIFITCVLLTLVVLVQNSKGGGLASNFAGSNQIMGVRKTADFLEKTTWTLALVLLVLSLLTIFVIPRNKGAVEETSELTEKVTEGTPKMNNFQAPPAGTQPTSQPAQPQQ